MGLYGDDGKNSSWLSWVRVSSFFRHGVERTKSFVVTSMTREFELSSARGGSIWCCGFSYRCAAALLLVARGGSTKASFNGKN